MLGGHKMADETKKENKLKKFVCRKGVRITLNAVGGLALAVGGFFSGIALKDKIFKK
jgi:hypothetical protein